jgi:hypothetical protein
MEFGRDGKNYNDLHPMFWTPLGGGVGKIGGVITFISLFTSSVVYKGICSKEFQQRCQRKEV